MAWLAQTALKIIRKASQRKTAATIRLAALSRLMLAAHRAEARIMAGSAGAQLEQAVSRPMRAALRAAGRKRMPEALKTAVTRAALRAPGRKRMLAEAHKMAVIRAAETEAAPVRQLAQAAHIPARVKPVAVNTAAQ